MSGMLPFDPFAPLSTLVGSPLRSVAFVPPVDVAVSDSDVIQIEAGERAKELAA
jgi:hypothetical protein